VGTFLGGENPLGLIGALLVGVGITIFPARDPISREDLGRREEAEAMSVSVSVSA
jgi:hypothetical protein